MSEKLGHVESSVPAAASTNASNTCLLSLLNNPCSVVQVLVKLNLLISKFNNQQKDDSAERTC